MTAAVGTLLQMPSHLRWDGVDRAGPARQEDCLPLWHNLKRASIEISSRASGHYPEFAYLSIDGHVIFLKSVAEIPPLRIAAVFEPEQAIASGV